MVISLPRLRRPTREDLPKRSDLPDAGRLTSRIKLPGLLDLSGLPKPAELAERIKLPKLPDRRELAQRVKVPELPDINLPEIDLSSLPRRFPWRERRAVDRAAGIRSAAITMVAIAMIGIAAAVAAYFLDPDRGKVRRVEAANRVAGFGRQARSRVQEWGRSRTSMVGSNAVVGSDGDHTSLVPEKSPLNGEMGSPNGTVDDLVPANPGI